MNLNFILVRKTEIDQNDDTPIEKSLFTSKQLFSCMNNVLQTLLCILPITICSLIL